MRPAAPRWAYLVLALVLIAVAGIRIHLLQAPFERDEGEYAYMGQLMLDGFPPYSQAYNMKLPGTYATYAVMLALFGQTHGAVHFGLLLANLLSAVLIFAWARRAFDPVVGVLAAAIFSILSVGEPVQGIFANSEHF